MPNKKPNSKETKLDTDEESGSQEGTVFPEGPADIRQVGSAETGAGYEASFLVVGPGEEVDAKSLPSWKGTWLCRPYKRERLLEEIYAANRKGSSGHAAVLNTLKNTGVMIFIIDSKISTTTADIVDSLRNVIDHLSNEERARPTFNPRTSQRCLLYRDHEGRFFNLTLADHTTAQASQWKGLLDSFSSFQATSILALLARSLGCASERKLPLSV
jgi:hypothetical protein